MGWAIGYVNGRDVGYGVPATCDYPTCKTKIDRGVSYCCGGFGTDSGCGLYFCSGHLEYVAEPDQIEAGVSEDDADWIQLCEPCAYNAKQTDWRKHKPTFEPKPDRPIWVRWKLKHSSWKQWREENPEEVEELKAQLTKGKS